MKGVVGVEKAQDAAEAHLTTHTTTDTLKRNFCQASYQLFVCSAKYRYLQSIEIGTRCLTLTVIRLQSLMAW